MAQVNPIHVQKFLKGVDYPATKEALLDNAKKLKADADVLAALEQLPGKRFETPADVSEALGAIEKR
jgi:hypothetical protein